MYQSVSATLRALAASGAVTLSSCLYGMTSGEQAVARFENAALYLDVRRVVQVTADGRPSEQRIGITGVVLGPDRLIVTSWSALNPPTPRSRITPPGNRVEDLEPLRVSARRNDGTSVDLVLVHKDEAQDVAIFSLAVRDQLAEMPWVPLESNTVAEGRVLESYLMIGRGPPMLNHALLMRYCAVEGVIEKPFRSYILTNPILGGAAFDSGGRLLGVCVRGVYEGRPQAHSIILPASALARLVAELKAE